MILDDLKALLDARGDEIEAWLGAKRDIASPMLTTSVDLRHGGNRLVPVDTNVFPAGFQNLSEAGHARAVQHFKSEVEGKRVLLIPENHTRNMPYLENLATLSRLLKEAGAEVQIGSLLAESEAIALVSPSGVGLSEKPLARKGDTIQTQDGFVPELIVLNNDMTAGVPALLDGIAQPVLPPLSMGWHTRRKSTHFSAYCDLVQDFGKAFGIDPWLINAEFHQCGKINFKEHEGLDCLAKGIDKVLARVREKYKQYGIADDPYVFIKADSGTYGMGIMTAKSGDEVLEMNKKTRNKMQVIKEGAVVNEVIIQEGIPTIDNVEGKAAEPMIYLVDGVPVGGMYRVNGQRDAHSNLNAAGMEYVGMCDEREGRNAHVPVRDCHFRSFGLIGAIAALAAGREHIGLLPSKETCAAN